MPTTTTFVEYYMPDLLADDVQTKQVASRDLSQLDLPKGAYAFRFYDIVSDESQGTPLSSGRVNVSPMHYIGGRVLTLTDVQAEMPDAEWLINSIKGHGFRPAFTERPDHFVIMEEGAIHLEKLPRKKKTARS